MKENTIGVIGATGRVGRECLRYLAGHTDFTLLAGSRNLPGAPVPGTFQTVDVFDPASLARFCEQCALVINCAGPASVVKESYFVEGVLVHNDCNYKEFGRA